MLVAQASYGASNALSEVSAPPPYCQQATTNRIAPLDKQQGECTAEVIPISSIGEGPELATRSTGAGANGAVAEPSVRAIFSANDITHHTDPTTRSPGSTGVSGATGGLLGEEGRVDPSDQQSISDGSTLPPPYSQYLGRITV